MALPTGMEVLVVTALSGGGVAASWFAKQVIDLRDGSKEQLSELRSIKQSLYGNPDIKTPDGLVATVEATMTAVDQMHSVVTDLDRRVAVVERGCIAIHGELVVRPQG